jgi:hypothetical protein
LWGVETKNLRVRVRTDAGAEKALDLQTRAEKR